MEHPSFAFAAKRDPLDRHALNAVACGISSRKYARSLDPLPGSLRGSIDLEDLGLAPLRRDDDEADDLLADDTSRGS
jgi:hypothetical protein